MSEQSPKDDSPEQAAGSAGVRNFEHFRERVSYEWLDRIPKPEAVQAALLAAGVADVRTLSVRQQRDIIDRVCCGAAAVAGEVLGRIAIDVPAKGGELSVQVTGQLRPADVFSLLVAVTQSAGAAVGARLDWVRDPRRGPQLVVPQGMR